MSRWRYSHSFRAPDGTYYDSFVLPTGFVLVYAILHAVDIERTRRLHARMYGTMKAVT